ncbi:substrate-binding periplasmic protein [Alteromonas lipolytica]|uniref:Solute-binding protein family 3/N-terminal domain-containing protein n=1 Tax=Alteromonas lipolytica TaxID=1856405 RepID=A0A1E8FCD7_9ALTE|nr:transporter substrate-binding domain-containing protein [Alteromonas lipolytica]OFI33163.1 hypothetical protein BFC17_02570 [Alteromonas lipolytica]GGF61964.1 hypothetical protein GCM10011338_12910 [Alteromonas lipolytica]
MWRSVWLVCFILISLPASAAAPNLNSAVSGDFPEGLQTQFIRYLSAKLNAEAVISTMPYARRLIELDDGSLDLMVGVSTSAPIGGHTVLIYPAYDSLQLGIYVLKGNENSINQAQDLRQHILSLTRYADSDAVLQDIPESHIVPARSLEQKIEMLLKGRLDAFIHVAPSTNLRLQQMGLATQIVPAAYQPSLELKQYVAVSKKSWLYQHIAKLESIISQGVANGDFAAIRREYYAKPR